MQVISQRFPYYHPENLLQLHAKRNCPPSAEMLLSFEYVQNSIEGIMWCDKATTALRVSFFFNSIVQGA